MPTDSPILINGKSFSYTDINVTILGVTLLGISEINYSQEETTEPYFGTSRKPVSVGSGAVSSTGTITISMNDVEALRAVAPNGSLLNLPLFDIKATWINEGQTTTHVLKRCKFTDDGSGGAQGDTTIERQFNLFIADVDYQG